MRGTRHIIFLLVLGLAAPAPALAHAILIDSSPAAGAVVPAGTTALRLRFNSRIDARRSRVTLAGPDGKPATLTLDSPPPGNVLTATVTLAAGQDVLHWQVLAVDGHITRGEVRFTAKPPD